MRLQSQIECLLEEMRIKLSSVASDLLSVSGLCILWALARGEGDPKKLAALGEERLRHREEQLIDALAGSPQPMHRELLSLQLERLQLLHEQIARLNGMIAQALRPYQEVVARLAEVPRFGVDSRAAGDFRSGRTGQHLSLRRAVDLLGRDLSREGGKRRREPQQPFSERKQISAAGAEPGSHAAATSREAPRDAA